MALPSGLSNVTMPRGLFFTDMTTAPFASC
jgi:hypothetical protein